MPVLIIVLLCCIFSGCDSRPKRNPDELIFALDLPPTNLDPRIGLDATSGRLQQLIFSSLLHTDDQYQLQPDLAESWETPDPLTYIFHLRHDATFHDGKAVTSKDVIYTFKSLSDGSIKSTKAGTYRVVQSIEAPDDYTVVFKLKEPFAPFLWNLTRGAIGIIPNGAGPNLAKNPIGSGPFKFVRYSQDSEVVIERNDSYFGPKARLKTITFKIIPEAIVRALELRKGTVDMATNNLTPDMVEVFRNDSNLQVLSVTGSPYQYFAFNMQDPAFKDVRVRQAIAYAIDREKIIKYVLRDQAKLATGVLPPVNWAFEPNVKTYPYDPAKARQLLTEAGQPNFSFTFRCSTDDTTRMLAAVIQQQLKEAGITMEIRSNEFATFFADVQAGNFQAYSLRWVGGSNNDPDIFDLIFNSKRVPPNGSNRGRYFNPEIDRLIELGRRESDFDKRREAYHEIQRIVAEELPYISLWYWDNVAIFNKRIAGVKLPADGDYEFLSQVFTTADNHIVMR
jgi:peptide/nickel transport system substrate-binding protein